MVVTTEYKWKNKLTDFEGTYAISIQLDVPRSFVSIDLPLHQNDIPSSISTVRLLYEQSWSELFYDLHQAVGLGIRPTTSQNHPSKKIRLINLGLNIHLD